MWILLALAAYFLFAGATITDKYLLQRPIPDARVYAFYTGALGLFAFLLAPFGFSVPPAVFVILNILAGVLFIGALSLFFLALRMGEVSRVGVSLGGLVPFFTLAFIYISNGETPSVPQFLAMGLLAGGSIVITLEGFKNIFDSALRFSAVLFSALLFGVYFTLVKFLFQAQPFLSAFIWIKLGGAMLAVLFLFSSQVRKTVFEHKKSLPKKTAGIFVVKNAAGGVGALFQHLAVSLARFGEVAIVNALQGVQFALVFLFALLLTKNYPNIINEKIHASSLVAKSVGTAMVVAGVVLLAITS